MCAGPMPALFSGFFLLRPNYFLQASYFVTDFYDSFNIERKFYPECQLRLVRLSTSSPYFTHICLQLVKLGNNLVDQMTVADDFIEFLDCSLSCFLHLTDSFCRGRGGEGERGSGSIVRAK